MHIILDICCRLMLVVVSDHHSPLIGASLYTYTILSILECICALTARWYCRTLVSQMLVLCPVFSPFLYCLFWHCWCVTELKCCMLPWSITTHQMIFKKKGKKETIIIKKTTTTTNNFSFFFFHPFRSFGIQSLIFRTISYCIIYFSKHPFNKDVHCTYTDVLQQQQQQQHTVQSTQCSIIEVVQVQMK